MSKKPKKRNLREIDGERIRLIIRTIKQNKIIKK